MNSESVQQPRFAKAARIAVLILVGVVVGFVLLEVIVRVIEPRTAGEYVAFLDDPILHHKFPPYTAGKLSRTDFATDYITNSLGLRDREFAVPKPARTFRILMLGDSFTAGEGVNIEETFSKRLEKALSERAGSTNIEIINAGVGGYSPLLEFLFLRYYGLQFEPDLVILNMDISDLYDDIQYSEFVRLDSHGVPVAAWHGKAEARTGFSNSPFSGILTWMKDMVKEHTRLYNFVRFRVYLWSEQKKREGVRSGDLRYDKLAQLRKNYINRGEIDWVLTLKYVRLIRDTLQHRNIDFWMTLYPYGIQVNGREWREGRQFWGFEVDSVYSTWPQERMEEFCLSNGIRVINMCEDFKNTPTTEPFYLIFDGHWTSAGHELAAKTIYKELEPYLREKGVL